MIHLSHTPRTASPGLKTSFAMIDVCCRGSGGDDFSFDFGLILPSILAHDAMLIFYVACGLPRNVLFCFWTPNQYWVK